MIYIDTSLVVSLHVTEVRSYSAVSWFERRVGDVFLISDWTDVEVASALSRKVRSGKITEEQRQRAADAYAVMRDGLFQRLTIAMRFILLSRKHMEQVSLRLTLRS